MPSAIAVPATPGRAASSSAESAVIASPARAGTSLPRRSPHRPPSGAIPASTAIEPANSSPIAALESPRRSSRSSGATTSTTPRTRALTRMIADAHRPMDALSTCRIVASAGNAIEDLFGSRGSSTSAATDSPTAAPQQIRNGASKETTSAATPPSAGPAIEPTPVAPMATPSASPRLPGGAVSETSASAAIQLAADPTPWTARAATSNASESEAAMRPDPAPTTMRPTASRSLRPRRSAMRPSGSDSTAIGTAYAARVTPSASGPAPVRSSMVGRSGAIKPSSVASIITAPIAIATIARRRDTVPGPGATDPDTGRAGLAPFVGVSWRRHVLPARAPRPTRDRRVEDEQREPDELRRPGVYEVGDRDREQEDRGRRQRGRDLHGELRPARLGGEQAPPARHYAHERLQRRGHGDVDRQDCTRQREVLDAGVADRLRAEWQNDDSGDEEEVGDDHRAVDGRKRRDHAVVLEPVARDHREADREGDELQTDLVVESTEAGPDLRVLADLEAGDQKRQRYGEGGVDEADRAI